MIYYLILRTNFNVGRLMFDAGLSCNAISDHVFLTHGHSDHSASLYFHTLSENDKYIYVPEEIAEKTRVLLIAQFELCNPNIPHDPLMSHWTVVPVSAGMEFNIKVYSHPAYLAIIY